MWHIQREEFKGLKSGSSALNILYQEGCTYVMDNHLAAGWCWYNTLDRRKEYNFCHIDQHDEYKQYQSDGKQYLSVQTFRIAHFTNDSCGQKTHGIKG